MPEYVLKLLVDAGRVRVPRIGSCATYGNAWRAPVQMTTDGHMAYTSRP